LWPRANVAGFSVRLIGAIIVPQPHAHAIFGIAAISA
jgi:hypothetical protein